MQCQKKKQKKMNEGEFSIRQPLKLGCPVVRFRDSRKEMGVNPNAKKQNHNFNVSPI